MWISRFKYCVIRKAPKLPDSLKEHIDNTFLVSDKLRSEHLEKVSEKIKETFRIFFQEQNFVHCVLWAQYTPHFPTFSNQGFFITPREYSTYDDAYSYGDGEGYTLDVVHRSIDSWKKHYSEKKIDKMLAAVDSLEKIFTLSGSTFLDLFGDHVKIAVSRKRLTVHSYIHK